MMQHSNQKSTFERGFFRRAFQEFDEQSFFHALEERLQEQPYHRKNRGLKNTLLVFSYVLNIISALSASYFIYWLTDTLTGVAYLAYAMAFIFLFFLEQLKRKSSNEFFQVLFFQKHVSTGWLSLSLLCFALSVGSTFFGTEQGAKDVAPIATTLPLDATETEVRETITKLEKENAKYEKQTTKGGIIYFPIQKSIASNKEAITLLRGRLNEKQKERETGNKVKQEEHKKKINITASTLAWILVFLELIFECCIAYVWYYYYRSFVDWKQIANKQRQQNENASHHEPPPKDTPFQMPPPPYSNNLNGSDIRNETTHNPILGFLTDEQRKYSHDGIKQEKQPIRTCTGLYRADTYCVPHTYQKGGQDITVHYTKQQVQARLKQYQRELEEAERKKMKLEVIENRKEWVVYWSGKLGEIEGKTV